MQLLSDQSLLRCIVEVFARVSIEVKKLHDPKQLGEDPVCYAYTPLSLSFTESSPGRNSNGAETWRQELSRGRGEHCLLELPPQTLLTLLQCNFQTTSPGVTPLIMGWTFPHQSPSKKMPYMLVYSLIFRIVFSVEVPPFRRLQIVSS